jgi:hypothetical protein
VTCISRQLRNELVIHLVELSDTNFVPNIFFNLRHHQIPAAVSLSREAQSQGA